MKKIVINNLLVFVFATLFMVLSVEKVDAVAKFTLTPVTKAVTNGETLVVNVGIDSGGVASFGGDAVVNFTKDKLEVVSVVKSTANSSFSFDFPDGSAEIDQTNGTIRFGCIGNVFDENLIKPIKTDVIVITFKAIDSGTATVKFDCTAGSGADTNIAAVSGDIVSCSDNSSGSYTITGDGSSVTPETTSTPTSSETTITPTSASPSTQLPRTGGVETTIGLLVFGVISLMSALFLKFL